MHTGNKYFTFLGQHCSEFPWNTLLDEKASDKEEERV